MLAAGLVMGVMIVPTVASLSEDAMSAGSKQHAARLGCVGSQPDADQHAGRVPGRALRASSPPLSSACPRR